MAGTAVLRRRNMVDPLAEADHVIVTGRAGHHAEVTRIVREKPGRETARRMAGVAVLGGWQVGRRGHPDGAGTVMAGITAHRGDCRRRMVDEPTDEGPRIVAIPAIRGRGYVADGVRLGQRVNHITFQMAGVAALQRGIVNMVENPAHAETRGSVATIAVERDARVPRDRAGSGIAVTGVTTVADNRRRVMIRLGPGEARRVMADAALGARIVGKIAVHRPDRDGSVMAVRATAGNPRVVEYSVHAQREETAGIVAGVAFGVGGHMGWRLADGDIVVVTGAAGTENLPVIDEGDNGESERRMAGLAGVGGRQV